MNKDDFILNLIRNSTSSEFAADALSSWLHSQYSKAINVADKISEAIILEDETLYNNAKDEIVNICSHMAITNDEMNLEYVSVSDLLDALHGDDESIKVNNMNPDDIMQNYIDSANINEAMSIGISTLLNDELSSVSEKTSAFYNEIQIKLGAVSDAVAAYSSSMFDTIKNSKTYNVLTAKGILNWLNPSSEPADVSARDVGAEVSGVSAYGAMVSNLNDFAQGMKNGIKKIGQFLGNIFGGVFKKMGKGIVTYLQQVTGTRDAFTVEDEGEQLVFPYGRNFKISQHDLTQMFGDDRWKSHITDAKYFQIQLPAGYMILYFKENDNVYVYGTMYTKPINKATYKEFVGSSSFSVPQNNTSGVYVTSGGVTFINPQNLLTDFGITMSDAPSCTGYFTVPRVNLTTMLDRFLAVKNGSISGSAEWLATDRDMWDAICRGNDVNFNYIACILQAWFSPSFNSDTAYLWHQDDPTMYEYGLVAACNRYAAFFYDEALFNTNAIPRGRGHSFSVRNVDLAYVCTGFNAARTYTLYTFSGLGITCADALIGNAIYYIYRSLDEYDPTNVVPYLNKVQVPTGKYVVLSDSDLAKSFGESLFAGAAIASVVIALVIAMKARRAGRAIKASIGAQERQLTDQLAALKNGWSSENWATVNNAYKKINKLNKWATSVNAIANAIYAGLGAIPGYIIGKTKSALSSLKTSMVTAVTNRNSLDSNNAGLNNSDPISLEDIYRVITQMPSEE